MIISRGSLNKSILHGYMLCLIFFVPDFMNVIHTAQINEEANRKSIQYNHCVLLTYFIKFNIIICE